MIEAEGLCSDDLYHAVQLLSAVMPTLNKASIDEAIKAEREACR
jgi:hypothetical protein